VLPEQPRQAARCVRAADPGFVAQARSCCVPYGHHHDRCRTILRHISLSHLAVACAVNKLDISCASAVLQSPRFLPRERQHEHEQKQKQQRASSTRTSASGAPPRSPACSTCSTAPAASTRRCAGLCRLNSALTPLFSSTRLPSRQPVRQSCSPAAELLGRGHEGRLHADSCHATPDDSDQGRRLYCTNRPGLLPGRPRPRPWRWRRPRRRN
jgi:hypothetical protein